MRIIAEKVGTRIYITSPYAAKDRIKSIVGARWAKAARAWTFPLDLEICRLLREEFQNDLEIGPELWQWAAAERAQEASLTSMTDVKDIDVMKTVVLPDIRDNAPTMWEAMLNRPYQPVASLYMAKARTCLNGDQPGIGKTIETLGALIQAHCGGPVLILAPKTSCQVVWEPEIERWLGDYAGGYTITQTAGLTPAKRAEAYDRFRWLLDRQAEGRNDAATMHFLIANAEQAGIKKFTACPAGICDGDEDWCPELDKHVNKSETRRPFLHEITWSAIIADETHKWLINTRGNQASQVGYGFTRLRLAENGLKFALTGTPLKGKKHNLFGTLNWLKPKTYSSKWRWAEQYFVIKKETVWAGRARGDIETKTIMDLRDDRRESFFRSLNTMMIRRTKDELRAINPMWMPPEKRYHDVYVEMEGKQKTHYKAMEKNAQVSLGSGYLSAQGVLAEMTRLRQFANSDGDFVDGVFKPMLPSGKFNWLLQFLEERGIEPKGVLSDEVHKVVVASQFTAQVNTWAAELRDKGIEAYVLTGETKDRDRLRLVDLFQNKDDVRVFLINTNAGGVSITLDAADDIVVMDETWVPDEQEQLEDRVHRASNVLHQVDVWYVRTKDTIEEAIAKTNEDKAKNNHVVLDARRGLKFAAERFGAQIKEEA